MSVTYTMFGAGGLNCRLGTLAEIGRSCLLLVVWSNLRFQTGFKAARFTHPSAHLVAPDFDSLVAIAVTKRRLP